MCPVYIATAAHPCRPPRASSAASKAATRALAAIQTSAALRSHVCIAAAPQLPAHFSALRSASAPSLLAIWFVASRSTAPAPLEAALLLVAACACEASPTRGSLVTCRVVTRDPFPWPGDAAPATCHAASTRLAAIACASQSALRHPPFVRRSSSARASTALQPAASLRFATVVRAAAPSRASPSVLRRSPAPGLACVRAPAALVAAPCDPLRISRAAPACSYRRSSAVCLPAGMPACAPPCCHCRSMRQMPRASVRSTACIY